MTEVDSPRSAWDLAAASRVVWSIYPLYLPPPFLWDSTWRMWLPDERKQSSKIYRSYLPTDAGYLLLINHPPSRSSTQIRLTVIRNVFLRLKKKKKEISSSRKIRMGRVSSTSFLVDKISSLHRKFILARVEENRARSLGTNRCLFFPLSVFAGERVRFSQFAPWPRKIAIGLGNTFTTGPGPVILLPEDFFSLYTLSESLLSFFFFLPFGILAFSRPFVSLIRFKRLWGPSIHIPPDFPE